MKRIRKIALFFSVLHTFSVRRFAPGFWRTARPSELVGVALVVLVLSFGLAGLYDLPTAKLLKLLPHPDLSIGAVYRFPMKGRIWYISGPDLNRLAIPAVLIVLTTLAIVFACLSRQVRDYLANFNFTIKNSAVLLVAVTLGAMASALVIDALAMRLAQSGIVLAF